MLLENLRIKLVVDGYHHYSEFKLNDDLEANNDIDFFPSIMYFLRFDLSHIRYASCSLDIACYSFDATSVECRNDPGRRERINKKSIMMRINVNKNNKNENNIDHTFTA